MISTWSRNGDISDVSRFVSGVGAAQRHDKPTWSWCNTLELGEYIRRRLKSLILQADLQGSADWQLVGSREFSGESGTCADGAWYL